MDSDRPDTDKRGAAELLGCSTSTVDRLRWEGEIPWHRVRGRVHFSVAGIEAYRQRQREAAEAEQLARSGGRPAGARLPRWNPGELEQIEKQRAA